MLRFVAGLVLLAGLVTLAAADPQPAPPSPPPPTVKLPVRSTVPAGRALAHPLLPDELDRTTGNAAPLWMRAGNAARTSGHKWTDEQYKWSSTEEMPLGKLPQKQVRELIAAHAAVFRLADQAARKDRCEWDLPPLTVQTLNDLPLDDVQSFRAMTNLLSIKIRLHLTEGDLPAALQTLQTGFALARDVGQRPTLIDSLVAMALTSIMLGRLEEYMAAPGAPNLYWSLTTLPEPFIELRRSIEHEMRTLHRSFPELRRLGQGTVNSAQAQSLVEELLRLVEMSLDARGNLAAKPSTWGAKLGIATMTAKYYPEAKKALIAGGRKAADVEAMPAVQVVAVFLIEDWDREADETRKWFSLPPWQARVGLEQQAKRLKEASARGQGNVLFALLQPATVKVLEAHTRVQRHVASLRVVEAIRLYAAAHEGKLPASLADVTEAPLPVNPDTGKGFGDYYKLSGDKAVLDVAPSPGHPVILGRRFELTRVR